MRLCALILAFAWFHLSGTSAAETGPTFTKVKQRGSLRCGVSQGLPGFSAPDKKGLWQGIDVDYCRAFAIAVLGDAKKVEYIPLSSKERFAVLQSGEIDVLSRNTSYTFSRDAGLGLDFVGVIYYDGQALMMHKAQAVKSAKELGGATICVNTGTTTELNLADYFRTQNLKYQPVVFEKTDEVAAAYESGRCDVYTTDESGLYAQRIKLKKPEEHVILPDLISKEPLGPVVRQGDDHWQDIARWVLYVLIEAEELGITAANAAELASDSKNPQIRRFLGKDGAFGEMLGLRADWTLAVIQSVGNYGEIFERNLGESSPLKIERGRNRLWNDGGLMIAMPLR